MIRIRNPVFLLISVIGGGSTVFLLPNLLASNWTAVIGFLLGLFIVSFLYSLFPLYRICGYLLSLLIIFSYTGINFLFVRFICNFGLDVAGCLENNMETQAFMTFSFSLIPILGFWFFMFLTAIGTSNPSR